MRPKIGLTTTVPLTEPVVNEEMKEAMIRAFESKVFLRGKPIEEFERDFAKYIGVKYAVAVNSGMSGMLFSLLAMNIGKGDKVITTSATFISTVNTIIFAGAEPLFADINSASYNINPDKVREAVEKNEEEVKAIIPVHLYGYPCDMDALSEIARKYNLKVIEDAAQAHGATYDNKKIGSLGDSGVFSLYPSKIITVAGDGGIITTNSEEIAEKCREFRDDGIAKDNPYVYNSLGYSARLSTINAAIGRVQLKYIDKWNDSRSRIVNLYMRELRDVGDIKLPPKADTKYGRVWYSFAISTRYRDQLKEYLEKNDIQCGISYKIPVHLQPPYRKLGFKEGTCPNVEKWSNEILSIPLYSQMTEKEAIYVIDHVKKFYQ